MNPIAAVVARPYLVAVAVLVSVLFSVLSIQRIPVQLKPTVDVPRVTVKTGFRGAGAVEVEEQITRELEDALQRVEGLRKMTSNSTDGQSEIVLEFPYGSDLQAAVVDVINKLTRVPRLPEEADEPAVEITSEPGPNAVMWIALKSGYEPARVRRVLEDEIRPRLERVRGVSGLFIAGGAEREIQVRVDPERMVGRGVSFRDLADVLRRGNLNVRGGTVETAERELVVRTVGRAVDAEQLESLLVRDDVEGGQVRLGDVARVVDTTRETTDYVSINGKPGISIGIQRRTGANVVEAIRGVDAAAEELNRSFLQRGLGIELVPVYRETTYIAAAISFVLDNLWLGSLLSIVVLFLFLWSPRSILFIAISIPTSLVVVFPVLLVLGRSLNVISLAGIAFASGIVVDNSISVLENIIRHVEMGKDRLRAAIDGGKEIWGGVLASTLTTVCVFAPVVLGVDEASQTFTDLALAISISTLISLVIALTVVPVLCALFGPKPTKPYDPNAAIEDENPGRLGRFYARLLDGLLTTRPGGVVRRLGFVALTLAACLATIPFLPDPEYLPTGNRNLIIFFASPVAGTNPQAAARNMKPLEDFILAQPETDRVFVVNRPGFNGGGCTIKVGKDDAKSLAAFHQRMVQFLAASPLAGFLFVVPVRSSLFNDPGKQFEVELSGPDFGVLERGAQDLQGRLMRVRGVQYVRSSLVTGRPELHVEVDRLKAQDLGLTVSDVGDVVETAVAGRRHTLLIDGGRDVDVNLLVAPERLTSESDLLALPFVAPDGSPVTLSQVAQVTRRGGPLSVRRLERQRNVLLTVNIAIDAPLSRVMADVERDVFPSVGADLGPAYTLGLGGSADKLRTTLAALSQGFLISILLVYLLLVALFRSWISPFVILVTVPLAVAGGVLGISLVSHVTDGLVGFDVIAMLGFIILAGNVVTNAILIVHQTNNLKDAGLAPRLALRTACATRLRPILMGVITTVTGVLPLAVGGGAGAELYQGLGAITVGGLTFSTIFTLFLVPVLLTLGYDARKV